MKRLVLAAGRLIAILAVYLLSPPTGASAIDTPRLAYIDRVRLAEAFRLAGKLGDSVWKKWSKTPFTVLLITPETEFLLRHPNPPADFVRAEFDPMLKSEVFYRKRVFPSELMATFPLNGVPTVIMGQAENTRVKTSSFWVITVLHEHFHQFQYSQSDYYSSVAALGLSRGDETGMWMLNFPFPYSNVKVEKLFSEFSRALGATVISQGAAQFEDKLSNYRKARKSFTSELTPDDYKYFSFQSWQEGVARYTEYRIAKLAAAHYKPGKEFRSLPDFVPFYRVADSTIKKIQSDLLETPLSKSERLAFYSVGAAEAMLADLMRPNWRHLYFTEKFSLESYVAE